MLRAILLAFLIISPLSAQAAQGVHGDKTVTIETNIGNIVIELFEDKAPVTVANFRQYVKESFYNNLIFHRVINGFMIQGGGFEPGMNQRKPTHPPISNEATNGLSNKRGTVAMARTYVINSATSQFFINLVDNPNLDNQGNDPSHFGYAVFGQVVEGMDIVDEIASRQTTTRGAYRDVPIEEILIIKAYENK